MNSKPMTSKELNEFGQTVAAGFAAGIEKSKMSTMKVFKMNDCDWVCAETEEQAKEYYKKECGFDDEDINEGFVGEVSLQDKMHILADDLPLEEQQMCQTMINIGGELHVLKTFEWVIKNDNITSPCIIASTEY